MHPRAIELLPANTAEDLWPILVGCLTPQWGEDRITKAFEAAFAQQLGGGHAATFSAGRVALAAVLSALGIGRGDEVVLPGYTCVAVPNPVLFCGATPIYADIDPQTLNLSADAVARVLTPRTRAIVAQHTFGVPAPMSGLLALARSRGIAVIEDCTHALGATLDGTPVGGFGDAAFFSFEQTKVVSAGAGGVAFTRDPGMAKKIAAFQSGCDSIPASSVRRTMAYLAYTILLRDPRWATRFPNAAYYLSRLKLIAGPETTEAEMNCEKPSSFERRWSGAQARVGLSQLAGLARNLERRASISRIYAAGLAGTRVGLFRPPPGAPPAFVRFPVRVMNKQALAVELAGQGIQLGLWFTAPVHPAGVPQEKAGYVAGTCPHAEAAVAQVANLPTHPRMIEADARRVVDAVLRSKHA